jgi:hypothetical protein
MRRAAVESLDTRNRWSNHLRLHRIEGTSLACVCELQVGRFRKGQRIGGCGKPRCWVCHSGKLRGEPTMKQLRSLQTYREGLAEALPGNNPLERSSGHGGRAALGINGVLARTERPPCVAAQVSR